MELNPVEKCYMRVDALLPILGVIESKKQRVQRPRPVSHLPGYGRSLASRLR